MSSSGGGTASPVSENGHGNPYATIARNVFVEGPPLPDLVQRILSDPRMHDHTGGFLSCLQCGICTSGCPAARFADYSPREIARRALELHATTVILAHNHPSGSTEASRDDIAMTREVRRALQPLGVNMHDHLIVTGDACVSMRQQGLLT